MSIKKPFSELEKRMSPESIARSDELAKLMSENIKLRACVDKLDAENSELLSQREKFDCSYAGRLRDDPSLIHCPPTRPCQKHRLENLQRRIDEIRCRQDESAQAMAKILGD